VFPDAVKTCACPLDEKTSVWLLSNGIVFKHVLQKQLFVNTHFPASVGFTKGEDVFLEQEKRANKFMTVKK
jgi:hypothetical protein